MRNCGSTYTWVSVYTVPVYRIYLWFLHSAKWYKIWQIYKYIQCSRFRCPLGPGCSKHGMPLLLDRLAPRFQSGRSALVRILAHKNQIICPSHTDTREKDYETISRFALSKFHHSNMIYVLTLVTLWATICKIFLEALLFAML